MEAASLSSWQGVVSEPGQNLLRKLNEASIALALEKQLSKDEILQLYLNQIYMGQGQYGVKSAAERYFGITDLEQLEIGQIATLAAIPKGPSIYNPADNIELSTGRRDLVLRIMQQHKLITTEQMTAAMKSTYVPPIKDKTEIVGASYMDAAIQEAMRQTGLSQKELSTGGYTLVTGMNIEAQRAMERAFSQEEAFPPDGKNQRAEAAMVIMDQRTGEVAALLGGRSPRTGGLNRAVTPSRQPGSALKPIIDYGPALESGKYTPDSLLPDIKTTYGSYSPANLNGVYRGQVSMRVALQQSINAPAVWLLKQVGSAMPVGLQPGWEWNSMQKTTIWLLPLEVCIAGFLRSRWLKPTPSLQMEAFLTRRIWCVVSGIRRIRWCIHMSLRRSRPFRNVPQRI